MVTIKPKLDPFQRRFLFARMLFKKSMSFMGVQFNLPRKATLKQAQSAFATAFLAQASA